MKPPRSARIVAGILTLGAIAAGFVPTVLGVPYEPVIGLLTLTLITGVWYGYFALSISGSATEVLRLALVPALTVEFRRRERSASTDSSTAVQYDLHMRNMGKGAALDVTVDPVDVTHDESGRVGKFDGGTLRFQVSSPLDIEATSKLGYISTGDGLQPDLMIPFQHYSSLGKAQRIVVRFRDVQGTRYQQELVLSRNVCDPQPVMRVM